MPTISKRTLRSNAKLAWLRVLYWMFRFALRRLAKSRGACANRWMEEFTIGHLQVAVVTKDRLRPEGYSREELVVMLGTVREHEEKMGWRVPEKFGSEAQDNTTCAKPRLAVEDAGRLLRALQKLEKMLESLASERFSASFERDHSEADAMLLGIGFRVANLAGGFGNLDLVAAWHHRAPLPGDELWSKGDDEQALGRLVRSEDIIETHPLAGLTGDQVQEAIVKRRALIQQNRCPQCQQQMLGRPRACPVHGMPS